MNEKQIRSLIREEISNLLTEMADSDYKTKYPNKYPSGKPPQDAYYIATTDNFDNNSDEYDVDLFLDILESNGVIDVWVDHLQGMESLPLVVLFRRDKRHSKAVKHAIAELQQLPEFQHGILKVKNAYS